MAEAQATTTSFHGQRISITTSQSFDDVLARLRQLIGDGTHFEQWPCSCRECHPGRSSGMFVLVQDAAEAVAPTDVGGRGLAKVGARCGQRVRRSCVCDALVRSMPVVEAFEFSQAVQ
jgi:hypothetical protein